MLYVYYKTDANNRKEADFLYRLVPAAHRESYKQQCPVLTNPGRTGIGMAENPYTEKEVFCQVW